MTNPEPHPSQPQIRERRVRGVLRALVTLLLLGVVTLGAVIGLLAGERPLWNRWFGTSAATFTGTFPEDPAGSWQTYRVVPAEVDFTAAEAARIFGIPESSVTFVSEGSVDAATLHDGGTPALAIGTGQNRGEIRLHWEDLASAAASSPRETASAQDVQTVQDLADSLRASTDLRATPCLQATVLCTSVRVQPMIEGVPVSSERLGYDLGGSAAQPFNGYTSFFMFQNADFVPDAHLTRLTSAEEAWDRYTHWNLSDDNGRAEAPPRTKDDLDKYQPGTFTFTSATLGQAAFTDPSNDQPDALDTYTVRPAWLFTTAAGDTLAISADPAHPSQAVWVDQE